MKQKDFVANNRAAWNADAYAAWLQQYGSPEDVAKKTVANPLYMLRRILPYIPNPMGLRIANPLGSHGRRATALALLGAEVTVFDISESNARYALELSAAAGVKLHYVVGDFLEAAKKHTQLYDIVVLELGIVHYFLSLDDFANAIKKLMKPNAVMVLNEFHPLLAKSITIRSDDIAVKGDYFDTNIHNSPTPYAPYSQTNVPQCLIRRWNLGEIITAFAVAGLRVEKLDEHRSNGLGALPGTFTLVASTA